MAYSLHTSTGFITDDQIIALLDPAVAVQAAHAQAIRSLKHDMCRYSNQDLDVLSAAYRVAIEGRTEVRPYEAKWVEAMVGA